MKRDDQNGTVQRIAGRESGGNDVGGCPQTRWQAIWRGLDLPPSPSPPPGFTGRVLALAEARRDRPLGLPMTPVWARAVATLALVGGIVAGVGLGLAVAEPAEGEVVTWNLSSLAEEYLDEALAAVAPEAEAE